MTSSIREIELRINDRPARVFTGGEGDALILVHGGWAGAHAHWSSVWSPLAQRFRVIAPDLPGVGDVSQPGLGTIGAYAQWLRAVLDALDVPRAWCVGNSFGASVVNRFAQDFPERCRGLVFVNGFPLPRTPDLLRRLGERRFGKRVVRAVQHYVAYRPRVLRQAFVDLGKVPDEIRRVLEQDSPAPIQALADVVIEGGGSSKPPPFAPLLLWGEDDQLPGTSKRSAEKLAKSLGAALKFIPRTGHMPQVEDPSAFTDALSSFCVSL